MYGILNLIGKMNGQKQAYMIILIVFIVVVVLVYISMVYIVYQQNVKQACFKMRVACKIILAVVMLLTLAISLITLFMYFFNLTVSTVCNVADTFYTVSDFTQYFNTTDFQLVQLANKCIGQNANGDLFAVINISQFSGLQTLLTGIQNYKLV